MGKKGNILLVGSAVTLLFVFIVAGVIYYSDSNLFSIESGANFVAPDWSRIGCEVVQNNAPLWVSPQNVPSSGGSYYCNVYTRFCSITISSSSFGVLTGVARISKCNNDGTNCNTLGEIGANSALSTTITPTQKIYVVKRALSGSDWNLGAVQVTGYADRYALAISTGGGRWIAYNPDVAGCYLPSVPAGKVDNACIYSNPMEFDTWCNYVSDFHPSYGYSVYSHPTYGQVYCAGTSIYTLTKVQTNDGVKYLSPDVKPETMPKAMLLTTGKYVGEVECCPNIATGCGDNFKFGGGGGSCFSDIQCSNGGAWATCGNKVICQETCDSGKCTIHKQAVECASDADCPITKPNCNRKTWTCQEGGKPPICGDGVCNGLETNEKGTVSYCPEDCGEGGGIPWWVWVAIGVIIAVVIALVIAITIMYFSR